MSTATAFSYSGVSDNVVNQPRPTTPQEDPHATRWGYGAGLYSPQISARVSGQQSGFIEQGKFVPFKDFKIQTDINNLESAERTMEVEVTAYEALYNTLSEFGMDANKRGFVDFGVLAGVNDRALIAAYAFVVNPDFKDIQLGEDSVYACPEGLTVCPTCRYKFLGDLFIETRFNEYQQIRLSQNLPGITLDVCFDLRDRIQVAVDDLLMFYRDQWEKITSELNTSDKGSFGLKGLNADTHYIRRCLHESAPEERQADMVTAYGSQIADAMNESNRQTANAIVDGISQVVAGNNNNDAFMLLLKEMQEERRANAEDRKANQEFQREVLNQLGNGRPQESNAKPGVKK